ncbi:MAG: DUF4476 domain-containing protein [Bacteroidetes bacterium]|nr:DUF4476 domain-containing protein [Bacteroidota bacterium]MBL0096357.1 DUF4476 domain-containing protein [Bacteroidota bacterium]
MKRLTLLGMVLLLSFHISAQTSNVVLFTENGERFTAILNGIRQNDKPETNVKITGLSAEFYKLKVIFESTALGEKNFNMAIELGKENTYVIKKNNKGEFVLRFMGSVPLAEAPRNTPAQSTVVYHANPVAQPVEGTMSSQTVTTTTTTQGASTGDPEAVSLNMGMNVDGVGGNISINVSGMDGTMQQTGTTTVTHTQTTTTTTNVTGMNTPPPPPAPVVYLPGYNGPVGCPIPMSPQDFDDLKQTVSSKSFEETKFTISKQVLQDRCMLVSQVKQMMLIFTFEQTRLDFAKFAYDRTYDIGNYFKVNDAFTFESSIEDLNEYIDARR